MNKVILKGLQLSKSYPDGQELSQILHDISLELHEGESVAVTGASGSGKSTLLHLLGGLDRADSGEVIVDGQSFEGLSDAELCRVRGEKLGFVYQFHHLLPEFSALENVSMPLLLSGADAKQSSERARAMLAEVGLEHRLHHKPGMLSGGERQRAAIARAIVHEPKVLLADEPTGNLDQATAEQVFELLAKLQEQQGLSMVLVTHDLKLAAKTDRVLNLVNGHWA